MEPEKVDKGRFNERLTKLEETIETVLSTLRELVEEREAPSVVEG